MVIELPFESLEPYISKEQLLLHYEIHHKNYDKKLKTLISKEEYDLGIDYILTKYTEGPIYNNCAQIYNHNRFWESMELNSWIPEKNNEIIEKLIKEFLSKANSVFGSGWVWILEDLSVEITSNANIPNKKNLIVLDLWEHAYYLDYKYDRSQFIEIFIKHLMNWNIIYKHLRL